MMEKIRLLGITLLVMTSQAMTSTQALAAQGEPVAPLTVVSLTESLLTYRHSR